MTPFISSVNVVLEIKDCLPFRGVCRVVKDKLKNVLTKTHTKLSLEETVCFKCTPITTSDANCSFSKYKTDNQASYLITSVLLLLPSVMHVTNIRIMVCFVINSANDNFVKYLGFYDAYFIFYF